MMSQHKPAEPVQSQSAIVGSIGFCGDSGRDTRNAIPRVCVRPHWGVCVWC